MDRLAAMTSFVKVVENAGFSAAARRLNVSPSIVTTHIQALEDRLGVRLLNRTTRKISLTEVGHAYYERCVQVLAEIDEADQIAQAEQLRPRGLLRLNVAQAIPPVIAAPLVDYVSRFPDVSVRVTVTSHMVDLVEEGLDLAIRLIPVADTNLIVRHLAKYRMVICGAPRYFARRGCPQRPADLVRHNCLFFYDSHWSKEWHFAGPDGEEIVRLSGNLETNSVVALRLAAVLGEGLICVPSFMVAAEVQSGELVPVLSEFLPSEFSVDALYPHRRHLSAKVRTFIDLVAQHFSQAEAAEGRKVNGSSAAALFPGTAVIEAKPGVSPCVGGA